MLRESRDRVAFEGGAVCGGDDAVMLGHEQVFSSIHRVGRDVVLYDFKLLVGQAPEPVVGADPERAVPPGDAVSPVNPLTCSNR